MRPPPTSSDWCRSDARRARRSRSPGVPRARSSSTLPATTTSPNIIDGWLHTGELRPQRRPGLLVVRRPRAAPHRPQRRQRLLRRGRESHQRPTTRCWRSAPRWPHRSARTTSPRHLQATRLDRGVGGHRRVLRDPDGALFSCPATSASSTPCRRTAIERNENLSLRDEGVAAARRRWREATVSAAVRSDRTTAPSSGAQANVGSSRTPASRCPVRAPSSEARIGAQRRYGKYLVAPLIIR